MDPLARMLSDADVKTPTQRHRVDEVLGHRPGALEAIRQARRRGLSFVRIANLVNEDPELQAADEKISKSSIQAWLLVQKIEPIRPLAPQHD